MIWSLWCLRGLRKRSIWINRIKKYSRRYRHQKIYIIRKTVEEKSKEIQIGTNRTKKTNKLKKIKMIQKCRIWRIVKINCKDKPLKSLLIMFLRIRYVKQQSQDSLREYLTEYLDKNDQWLKEYIEQHEGYFRHVAGLCKCYYCTCRHCKCDYVKTNLTTRSMMSDYMKSYTNKGDNQSQKEFDSSVNHVMGLKGSNNFSMKDESNSFGFITNSEISFRDPGRKYPQKVKGYQPIPKQPLLGNTSAYNRFHRKLPLTENELVKDYRLHTFKQQKMKGNSNYDLSFKKNNVDKKDLVYKVTNTNVPLTIKNQPILKNKLYQENYYDKQKEHSELNQEPRELRSVSRVTFNDTITIMPKDVNSWNPQYQTESGFNFDDKLVKACSCRR